MISIFFSIVITSRLRFPVDVDGCSIFQFKTWNRLKQAEVTRTSDNDQLMEKFELNTNIRSDTGLHHLIRFISRMYGVKTNKKLLVLCAAENTHAEFFNFFECNKISSR